MHSTLRLCETVAHTTHMAHDDDCDHFILTSKLTASEMDSVSCGFTSVLSTGSRTILATPSESTTLRQIIALGGSLGCSIVVQTRQPSELRPGLLRVYMLKNSNPRERMRAGGAEFKSLGFCGTIRSSYALDLAATFEHHQSTNCC